MRFFGGLSFCKGNKSSENFDIKAKGDNDSEKVLFCFFNIHAISCGLKFVRSGSVLSEI